VVSQEVDQLFKEEHSSPSSSYLYTPLQMVKVQFEVGLGENYKNGDHTFHAIQWPQDSKQDAVDRILTKGKSPFPRDSIFVYPDQILDDLFRNEQELRLGETMTIATRVSKTPERGLVREGGFWNYYNVNSTLNYDTQCTFASAISMFEVPKVMVFGSGLDSPLFCKATIDMHSEGKIFFIENDPTRYKETKVKLKSLSNGQCEILSVSYGTVLYDWMENIGNEEDLARGVIRQLPSHVGVDFDVILVDGPVGSDYHHPGRMASLSAASKLLRGDGEGILFVDDINRKVEAIFSRYLFRPKLGKEIIVRGWGNTWKTAFFTQNTDFLEVYVKDS